MEAREAIFHSQLEAYMVGEGASTRDVVVYVGSQPAIILVHNPVYHARSKQILAKYLFIRDRVHQETEIEI